MNETAWRELCELAKREGDVRRFLSLMDELGAVVEQQEARLLALSQQLPGFSLLIH